jgi:hypothetical protein
VASFPGSRLVYGFLTTAPKYSNASFKCIADYDKCRLHRGDKGLICSLAFVLCMVKNGAALVNAAAKAAKASMGG